MAHVQFSDRNQISDYTAAVHLVFEIQNELQVDLRALIQLLQVFFSLPEQQVLFPRAVDYPPFDGLQQQIMLAVDSSGAKTLVCERLRRVLPVIVTLYDLYSMRIDAIATQNSTASSLGLHHRPANVALFVPPEELVNASTRVALLRPIDEMINYYYEALQSNTLNNPSLAVVINFAYQMVSHHGPEQLISGQSAPGFFLGLCRPASRKYLAFVYLSTQYQAHVDIITPHEVLDWAEKITEPIHGAEEQGYFLRRLFPAKVFDSVKHRTLPSLTKVALRSPYEVWPSLQGRCLCCGSGVARYLCSLCQKIKYCSSDCQRGHWKASHRIACAMYCSSSV